MILSVHQPQYLPWLGYFDKIKNSDAFVFLDNVQYKKREFQNRNRIRTREGSMWLTVPVISKDRFYQKISEVLTNGDTDWAKEHLKSIECNYSKSEFFHNYITVLRDIYSKRWEKLIDINLEFINLFLKTFEIKTPVYFESTLSVETTSSQRIIDICRKMKADTYLSGQGAREYMDENLFKDNNIKVIYQDFKHPQYKQQFEGFESHLSVLDYLLNNGPKLWQQQ
ncbi:MAG TPA: hypothetical protein DEE98_02655 [Elusimicrobia bacterium]|nr:MAG: hypothetical protein A2278_07485 [Elusimicrobia bacterium RIFOXYA12_FULL_49_49]OGS10326.1 MAG: hypothetical protein A2204_07355 [Elusimicrobia bacterium RIFOXYA1_FULL_47_7]OGS11105.1 MAG: hypothetical protein A2386_05775 [Elusimicrobia bacterium RIFOXYB1_FULL_48_9]OGS16092.1 MAG: hypothetical protein A2251_02780 [Elusimicrobia bacterium RIFOXYA2_FULL_47_53]OGS26718.1 MAG: hypothetical protein A2339_03830 [Elusimicrobia bacterium RIFOXYB12_FULL_50_12]OGS30156.1 MAG: hypothetical protein